MQHASSIHQFRVVSLRGGHIDLADFEGKKILVVNVASQCGFTSQYQQLEELYQEFKDKLVIIGFPCNDFGGQEPGDSEEILTFCQARYGVTFPLTEKIHIKGPDIHPVYQWLTQKAQNGVMDSAVRWNFHKYLLDERGVLLQAYSSSVSPVDEPILGLLS